MDFGFVPTYLIRLIFGKTKDRKYILQLYKDLHLRRSVFCRILGSPELVVKLSFQSVT